MNKVRWKPKRWVMRNSWRHLALTPALSHPTRRAVAPSQRVGEGEWSSGYLRILRRWKFRTANFAVPSPIGWERVRVRVSQ
jgi:hypothetical protein